MQCCHAYFLFFCGGGNIPLNMQTIIYIYRNISQYKLSSINSIWGITLITTTINFDSSPSFVKPKKQGYSEPLTMGVIGVKKRIVQI